MFEPPTKVSPVAIPEVHLESAFTYAYSLRNLSSARQVLFAFDLSIGSTPISVRSPVGWMAVTLPQPNSYISWTSVDAGINPGSQLGGFSMKSNDIPGIVALRLAGLADSIRYPDEPPADVAEAVLKLQREARNSFVTLYSVGPSTFTYTSPLPAVDRLIGIKHQAASLGWLGNAKFVAKLDKRLDQAKAALARDKKKLARVRLTQFAHDLTKVHQKDGGKSDSHDDKNKADRHPEKFVNNEAFQLLKINADFIIAKLPTKGKDRAEDNECRRAENEKDDDR
ncbi:MAG: hypothetical protein AAB036_02655 [Elusimicrobiota bacterium]